MIYFVLINYFNHVVVRRFSFSLYILFYSIHTTHTLNYNIIYVILPIYMN